jgi:tyrosyl-tRNA synthetase
MKKVDVDKNLLKTLKERGLLYQSTDEEMLKKMLENGTPITVYEGTDPTADSLHIGHCVPYCILRRFQQAGHKVVLLMGGATACIGDPSGKSEIRKIMDKKTIQENIEKIKNTLKIFLNFEGDNPAIIVNNADWFKGYDYIDFMREIGVHFNVNKMLSNEIYAKRIEEGGLTFFEMGYMLMQAYDFVHLNKTQNCQLQLGGADQWANIVAGVELGRKLNFINGTNNVFVGLTCPLLLTPEGNKMGKTEKGAIWMDKDKISAYDFYQGIYQTPDACVEMMFALFTDVPMNEVKKMIKEDIVNAKKRLSFEMTKFVRGEEDAIIAQQASEALFKGVGNLENAPTYEIARKDFENGLFVIDVAVNSKIISSKSEGRRLIEQNGLMLNDVKVSAFDQKLVKEDFKEGFAILKKGKKSFIKLIIV